MNLSRMRAEFLMEHGNEVQILADDIVDGTYYIFAREDDDPIYTYGTEEVGYEYHSFSEVGEPYQPWFKEALDGLDLKSVFNTELLRDVLTPE